METVGFVRKKFREITFRFQAFPENSIRFSHSPDGTESFCACQSTKLGGTAGKWIIKMPDDSLLKKIILTNPRGPNFYIEWLLQCGAIARLENFPNRQWCAKPLKSGRKLSPRD